MGKFKLLLEFNEFNLQRMNPDNIPMAMHVDNPELSTDGFDRHQANIQSQEARLGSILNLLSNTSHIYDITKDRIIHGQDITNLKIQRMIRDNSIDLKVYLTFNIGDKNYYGVINNFVSSPNLSSEVFRDSNLFLPKEWIIRTKGLIIKAIKKWMEVKVC